jgi:predicted ATPase/DNA-binding SARP family transcriptional activator
VVTRDPGDPPRRDRERGGDAAHEAVAVALLGAPRLRVAGVWSPLPPDRRGQLLAVLALAGDWVERDRIADLLWRDLPLEAARRNLRHLVHTSLRRDAAPGLEGNRRALRWRVASDVDAFDDAVARGDWAEAVAGYAGPLLPGFELRAPAAFAAWVEVEREQRRLRWRAAALEWARAAGAAAAVSAGAATAVAAALRPLVEDDLDEEALLVVLDVLERGGERARARMLLDAFQHRVGELFGVEPAAGVRRRVTATATAAAAQVAAVAPAPAVGRTPDGALLRPEAPVPAPASGPGALSPPSDAVPLLGREDELRRLAAWLDAGERLVTIVGAGGVGKSRLARALLTSRDPDGASCVVASMEAAAGPRDVASAIARAAGALVDGSEPEDAALVRALGGTTEHLLLDDVERAAAVAAVVAALLRARPALRIVVTALEPLRLAGERVLPLAGLDHGGGDDLPPERAQVLPAVALFRILASRHDPAYRLRDADLAAVREIAAALDGSPLGLELAAPWVRSLPVGEIARLVVGDPDFLAASDRDAPTRQRSLRAAFQHAAGLLTDGERAALVRLSLFVGSFTRDAAVLVAEAPLPILASLVDRSLLRPDADHRYAVPGPVRAYAREALAADPATERAALERLVRYAVGLVAAGFPADGFPNSGAVVVADREHAHLAAAFRAALSLGHRDEALRLAAVVATTSELRGRIREGGEVLDEALAAEGAGGRRSRRRRGRLLVQRAWLRHWGDPEGAAAAAAEARAALPPSDHVGHAWALRTLGVARWRAGAYPEAEAHLRDALALAGQADHSGWRAVLLDALGLCLSARGAFAAAEEAFREALSLNERHDNPFQATQNLINLASTSRARGDARAAVAYAGRAVGVARRIGYAQYVPHALTQLAACALAAGDLRTAAPAAEEAVATATRSGDGYVRIWSALVQAEVLEVGASGAVAVRAAAAGELGRALEAALAERDRKQLLHGTSIAARFAVARGDHDAAALTLAIVRLEPSTPAVVRRQADALLRQVAAELGLARRRAAARRFRRLGLEGAVQELRVRVAAWQGGA